MQLVYHVGGHAAKESARKLVDPFLHLGNLRGSDLAEVRAFRKLAADQLVRIFIAAPLPAMMGMAIENLCPLTCLLQSRSLHTLKVGKFGAVINRDSFEHTQECFPAHAALQRIQRTDNAAGSSVAQ